MSSVLRYNEDGTSSLVGKGHCFISLMYVPYVPKGNVDLRVMLMRSGIINCSGGGLNLKVSQSVNGLGSITTRLQCASFGIEDSVCGAKWRYK
jgi:hypothetical protein